MKRLLSRLRRLSRRQVLFMLLLFVLASGASMYFWLFPDLPSLDRLQAGLALPSTRIFDRHGRLLYEVLPAEGGRNVPLPLAEIPQHCINAVIATEDANFYHHPGVDVVGLVRAVWINLRGGEVVVGGSTITQQVARNLLFDPQQRAERTLRRKLREMILALQLQNRFSKDGILTLYLNQSYFGNLAYGIEGAARGYFGKSAGELSLAECALLGGLLQSPAAYDPLTQLERAQERQGVVLALMTARGSITAEQAAQARAEPLALAAVPFPIEAPHFVMAVIRQMERDYPQSFLTVGLDVTTTLDLDWQNAAERITRRQLDYLNQPPAADRAPANAHNAALVALDPYTGQILAMLGSPDYFDESIDGAVNAALALRQPGSALKPFTYAAAFDPTSADAWTGATMLLDVETPFITRRLESYTPANFALVEHGPVLARDALASSLNIPAVIMLEHVGIQALVELLNQAGVTTLANNPNLDLSLTLGGGEVRLLDLTAAYSIFANGGTRTDPAYILRVNERNGDTLYEWQSPANRLQVIDERVAYLVTDILSDDDARLMGFGRNSMLNIGRAAAAKTGTTTNFRDNWIVGYTPNLVVGVWIGNADNTPMVDVTGVSGAAPIWNAFMREVLQGQPELRFAEPAGMARMEVCALSGLLPTPACPTRRLELFIDGTQPITPDNLYQTVLMDRQSGLPADETTPPERTVPHTFIILPQEARDWGLRNGILPPPTGTRLNVPDAVTGLRLLEPDPHTVFRLSPLLPLDGQQIRLTVGAPPDTVTVRYTMDGVLLGEANEPPWELWWVLTPGTHELVAEAVLADGTVTTSAPLPFRVNSFAEPESYTEGIG
jgi:1A family penicillin-binding protein